MKLITDLNDAVKKLYEHVGFVEDWVLCPIDDCTENYWDVDEDTCTYADSKEQFESDGDYYQDDIYKQRHYSKWVYEGKELTMVMCDPQVDGVKWFRVFDNKKRM
tara:strand:+ start:2319 stop:2633 length:315 start_codon:yes stop_codon:yes gene_type:complete